LPLPWLAAGSGLALSCPGRAAHSAGTCRRPPPHYPHHVYTVCTSSALVFQYTSMEPCTNVGAMHPSPTHRGALEGRVLRADAAELLRHQLLQLPHLRRQLLVVALKPRRPLGRRRQLLLRLLHRVLQRGALRAPRVISDCHVRKAATEYDRATGIKLLSCTAK
jgi:hypothetical protein